MLVLSILLKIMLMGWGLLLTWLCIMNYYSQCLSTKILIDILAILQVDDDYTTKK